MNIFLRLRRFWFEFRKTIIAGTITLVILPLIYFLIVNGINPLKKKDTSVDTASEKIAPDVVKCDSIVHSTIVPVLFQENKNAGDVVNGDKIINNFEGDSKKSSKTTSKNK